MTMPQVAILGTYHFANYNLDYVKTEYDDHLSARRQAEIEQLLDQLTRYNPTKIAIEVTPQQMHIIDERYKKYLNDDYELTSGEMDQVGFRLARQLGHTQLYGIDYRQPMKIDDVLQVAVEKGQTYITEGWQQFAEEMEAENKRLFTSDATVSQLLSYHNAPHTDDMYYIYMLEATAGDSEHHIGAEDVGGWYTRNLKMFAEISWIADSPDERILVVVGSGHGVLLRQFLKMSRHLDYVDVLDYLTPMES